MKLNLLENLDVIFKYHRLNRINITFKDNKIINTFKPSLNINLGKNVFHDLYVIVIIPMPRNYK